MNKNIKKLQRGVGGGGGGDKAAEYSLMRVSPF